MKVIFVTSTPKLTLGQGLGEIWHRRWTNAEYDANLTDITNTNVYALEILELNTLNTRVLKNHIFGENRGLSWNFVTWP